MGNEKGVAAKPDGLQQPLPIAGGGLFRHLDPVYAGAFRLRDRQRQHPVLRPGGDILDIRAVGETESAFEDDRHAVAPQGDFIVSWQGGAWEASAPDGVRVLPSRP